MTTTYKWKHGDKGPCSGFRAGDRTPEQFEHLCIKYGRAYVEKFFTAPGESITNDDTDMSPTAADDAEHKE